MKLYFQIEKRSRNNVELSIVVGDCHPLLPNVRITKFEIEDGQVVSIDYFGDPGFPEHRIIYQGILPADDANVLISYLQNNYLNYLNHKGITNTLSESSNLKLNKTKEKKDESK